jgi:hypothetical protein
MERVGDGTHDRPVRVAAAGGGADQPEVQPYGTSARCSDDQGTRFWLLEATGQS